MAKKTKDTTNPATVAVQAAAKVAETTLRLNPEISEVHVTSDGTAFYTRNDAQNHANSLPNREVYSVRRGAAKAAATRPGASAPTPAANEPEIDELTGEAVNEPDNEPANTDE